jgi:hypothetical protein
MSKSEVDPGEGGGEILSTAVTLLCIDKTVDGFLVSTRLVFNPTGCRPDTSLYKVISIPANLQQLSSKSVKYATITVTS